MVVIHLGPAGCLGLFVIKINTVSDDVFIYKEQTTVEVLTHSFRGNLPNE